MLRKYTFGPIKSRRLGLSLGVDVLPGIKTCTFNCVYCEIGYNKNHPVVSPTFRLRNPPTKRFRKELKSMFYSVPNLDSITFGYNGEPTLNENLLEFYKIAMDEKHNTNWSETPPSLTLFTNSSTIEYSDIRERVKHFEVILAKLDVGTDSDFKRTNRPHKDLQSIDNLINSLKELSNIMPTHNKLIIQTLLYQSYNQKIKSNINSENIQKLGRAIKKINPSEVQLYSIARIPNEYFVYSADLEMLESIKVKLKKIINKDSIRINCY